MKRHQKPNPSLRVERSEKPNPSLRVERSETKQSQSSAAHNAAAAAPTLKCGATQTKSAFADSKYGRGFLAAIVLVVLSVLPPFLRGARGDLPPFLRGARGDLPPFLRGARGDLPPFLRGARGDLPPSTATASNLHLRVIVNSNQDGAITPDAALTLREAIEIVNGTLPLNRLSDAEKAQVKSLTPTMPSRIEFNLPPGQTTIRLVEVLPSLASPGLIIDGSTQPGYNVPRQSLGTSIALTPLVALAPAEKAEVSRGLTVMADGVTIRGLSLYGFTAKHGSTEVTLPADIFIASRLPIPDVQNTQKPGFLEKPGFSPPNTQKPGFLEKPGFSPPKDVVIENNWLGIPPDGKAPTSSAFGVYVFDSSGTTIRHNSIANHDSSGIITSVRAENLSVNDNILVGNGFAGMPDAIRLEGIINNSQVRRNMICGNAGSAVFLFRPEGAVEIRDNQIEFNGRRLRRAAIYLMGSNHKVINNQISNQNGPGVVVASYPQSVRNMIQGNSFAALDGLSIDLNTQHNVDESDFQVGDGPNPPRDSGTRRLDTGNAAINAPQFLAREFFVLNGKVSLDGIADAGSEVEVYRTSGNKDDYNPLTELLGTADTDVKGKFSISLRNLKPGDMVSAIATDPKYGTSEPARNALVKSLDGSITTGNSVDFPSGNESSRVSNPKLDTINNQVGAGICGE